MMRQMFEIKYWSHSHQDGNAFSGNTNATDNRKIWHCLSQGLVLHHIFGGKRSRWEHHFVCWQWAMLFLFLLLFIWCALGISIKHRRIVPLLHFLRVRSVYFDLSNVGVSAWLVAGPDLDDQLVGLQIFIRFVLSLMGCTRHKHPPSRLLQFVRWHDLSLVIVQRGRGGLDDDALISTEGDRQSMWPAFSWPPIWNQHSNTNSKPAECTTHPTYSPCKWRYCAPFVFCGTKQSLYGGRSAHHLIANITSKNEREIMRQWVEWSLTPSLCQNVVKLLSRNCWTPWPDFAEVSSCKVVRNG